MKSISQDTVHEIRRLRELPTPIKKIASDLGLSPSTVHKYTQDIPVVCRRKSKPTKPKPPPKTLIGPAEFPYTGTVYKVFHSAQGRYYAQIADGKGGRTCRAWAKYVYETTTGHTVPEGMVVDHVDEDRTNDDFSNLQLLTEEENRLKSSRYRTQQSMLTLMCPCCAAIFQRRPGVVNREGVTCCSRSCASRFSKRPNHTKEKYLGMNILFQGPYTGG